jgi:hypothetical protein
MPLAVVLDVPERKELKTVPTGFVTIRRMSYGEKLQRRGYNSKMEMQMGGRGGGATSIIDIFKEETELYDFSHCIVDHNLTKWVHRQTGQPLVDPKDPEGVEAPLDFKKPMDVKLLEGRVAEEIGKLIDELNNFEESEAVGNSKGESAPSS